jgi:hypothetical protein
MAKKKEIVPLNEEEQENQEQENPIIEYNNNTEQSYLKNGLVVADNVLNTQEKNFISQVDVSKQPIERTVTKIVRVKDIDYKSEKKERKEFLYYFENWNGIDWAGNRIAPVTDHIEGIYQEQLTNKVIQKNKVVGRERTGQRTVYYIPFSKNKVDDIIENSVGTDKETILFTFINGALGYQFPYDVFVNSSYEDLSRMLVAPGGPRSVLTNQQYEQQSKQQQQSKKNEEQKKEEEIMTEEEAEKLEDKEEPKQLKKTEIKEAESKLTDKDLKELNDAKPDNRLRPRFAPEKVKQLMIKYFEIKNNLCEICGQEARVAINDSDMNLHYSCLLHIDELYHKLNN